MARAYQRFSPLLIVMALALASTVGVLASFSPVVAVAATLGPVAIAGILATRDRLPQVHAVALGTVLIGYAFLGRGFAYIGVPPVYVGEVVLFLSACLSVAFVAKRRIRFLHALMFAFMLLGVARTVPYVPVYGIDALRDAVVWAYGLVALAVAYVASERVVRRALTEYARILPWFVAWVPISGLITRAVPGAIPHTPLSATPIVYFKGGDMAVHLVGVAAFVILGLDSKQRYGRRSIVELALWSLWVSGVAIACSRSRGALLTVAVGLAAATVISLTQSSTARTAINHIAKAAFVAAIVVTIALLVNFQASIGGHRTVTPGQIVANLESVVINTNDVHLETTKEWRVQWWSKIVGYTFDGRYFWTGKGFGINLADSDGFQVKSDDSLRSPHNGHLTILARMGVPGLIMWCLLQLGFAASLLRASFAFSRRGDQFLARVSAWVFVYWAAMMIDMSFDVYLEGPQGGIWFWSAVGLGLALITMNAKVSMSERTPDSSSNRFASLTDFQQPVWPQLTDVRRQGM